MRAASPRPPGGPPFRAPFPGPVPVRGPSRCGGPPLRASRPPGFVELAACRGAGAAPFWLCRPGSGPCGPCAAPAGPCPSGPAGPARAPAGPLPCRGPAGPAVALRAPPGRSAPPRALSRPSRPSGRSAPLIASLGGCGRLRRHRAARCAARRPAWAPACSQLWPLRRRGWEPVGEKKGTVRPHHPQRSPTAIRPPLQRTADPPLSWNIEPQCRAAPPEAPWCQCSS